MFGAKKKKSDKESGGVQQTSARGNMDEYEALRTIVAENAGLMVRVMEKMRVQRVMSGKVKKPGVEAPEEAKERTPEKKKPKE